MFSFHLLLFAPRSSGPKFFVSVIGVTSSSFNFYSGTSTYKLCGNQSVTVDIFLDFTISHGQVEDQVPKSKQTDLDLQDRGMPEQCFQG